MLPAWGGRRALTSLPGSRTLHGNQQPPSVFRRLDAKQQRYLCQAFPDLWDTVVGDRALALHPWSDHGHQFGSNQTLGFLSLQMLEELQC